MSSCYSYRENSFIIFSRHACSVTENELVLEKRQRAVSYWGKFKGNCMIIFINIPYFAF
jgi:hypothetical protein